ncbi:hypothetical protein EST38_g1055 [Candolleomyces aberdarensis]|uniref:PH domain-containing protein n=1 Tax=Candolleomyces aberdarensis TaxID=2316362 RepID=A0A4Q2DYA4_9AGAR|nr:hypothetical protein EST38_g1055 [Candolleomyces aberdarensis]
MTKADYIKNTSLAGLPSEVLGCYYDNIVFAPFIFIEDPLDSDKQVGLAPDGISRTPRTPTTPSNSGLLGKNKIDPYYLILNDLLDSMTDEVEKIVPLDEPFSYSGIGGRVWSEEELQRAFTQTLVVPVDSPRPRSSVTLPPNGSPADSEMDSARTAERVAATRPLAVKVTMVGVLNRKDDIGVRGKRNTFRKWRYWTVLLTGSKLLFFRDTSLAERVLRRANLAEDPLQDFSLGSALLKPDEIMSVKDAIAVYDSTYKKHDYTFRFILPDGRQTLLQASTVDHMDEWLIKINYASVFKSAGVQIRPLGMSPDEVQMTGVAAATSLLHDVQYSSASPSAPIQPWDSSISHDLMGMLSADSFVYPTGSPRVLVTNPYYDPDLDSPSIVEKATAAQFESTFRKVKEDLVQDGFCMENEVLAFELTAPSPLEGTSPTRPPTRSGITQRKIDELQSELAAVRAELDTDLRVIRNIAILKPFQKATRGRLLTPVQNVAGRVASLRLKIALLECHLSVLQQDVELEMRSLGQMQSVALAAAKKSLDRGSDTVPSATASLHSPEDDLEIQLGGTLSRRMSESSAVESFRSALDWTPEEEMDATPLSLAPSQLFDSPQGPGHAPNESSSSLLQQSPSYSSLVWGSHKELPGDDLAEEAEAWNRTRAAQRVSLIHVPSTIAFSHRQDRRN